MREKEQDNENYVVIDKHLTVRLARLNDNVARLYLVDGANVQKKIPRHITLTDETGANVPLFIKVFVMEQQLYTLGSWTRTFGAEQPEAAAYQGGSRSCEWHCVTELFVPTITAIPQASQYHLACKNHQRGKAAVSNTSADSILQVVDFTKHVPTPLWLKKQRTLLHIWAYTLYRLFCLQQQLVPSSLYSIKSAQCSEQFEMQVVADKLLKACHCIAPGPLPLVKCFRASQASMC